MINVDDNIDKEEFMTNDEKEKNNRKGKQGGVRQ